MKPKYVIHYQECGSVDWVGEVVKISGKHVVIHCVDAVCLFCDIWSLSDQKENVLIKDCYFFFSMADAKNACDTANSYFAI